MTVFSPYYRSWLCIQSAGNADITRGQGQTTNICYHCRKNVKRHGHCYYQYSQLALAYDKHNV